jgi:hypothetical protein
VKARGATDQDAPQPPPVRPAPADALDVVDETSLDSFPASDPPSWISMRAGYPRAGVSAAGDRTSDGAPLGEP